MPAFWPPRTCCFTVWAAWNSVTSHIQTRPILGDENGKWAVGYTAGAGGELKLTDRWSLRGEYRYMRFNVARSYSDPSRSTDFVSSDFISLNAGTTRSEADFHVGKIGVAYGFCACD